MPERTAGAAAAELHLHTEADLIAVRRAARRMAEALGFPVTDTTEIVTAVTEIARNITAHAGRGVVSLAAEPRDGRTALVVRAVDEGPGISDVARALEDGYTTTGGLGLGLPGARRLMDRLDIETRPGRGTVVQMWKWVSGGG